MPHAAFLQRYRWCVDDSTLPLPRKHEQPPDPEVLRECCMQVVRLMYVAKRDLQVRFVGLQRVGVLVRAAMCRWVWVGGGPPDVKGQWVPAAPCQCRAHCCC
jgi:hypothetical protein